MGCPSPTTGCKTSGTQLGDRAERPERVPDIKKLLLVIMATLAGAACADGADAPASPAQAVQCDTIGGPDEPCERIMFVDHHLPALAAGDYQLQQPVSVTQPPRVEDQPRPVMNAVSGMASSIGMRFVHPLQPHVDVSTRGSVPD